LRGSHDGSADDQKGKVSLFVNDGNDNDAPSIEAIRLLSTGVFSKLGVSQTWVPLAGDNSTVLTILGGSALYIRLGNIIIASAYVQFPNPNPGLNQGMYGLPATVGVAYGGASLGYHDVGQAVYAYVPPSSTRVEFLDINGAAISMDNKRVTITVVAIIA